MRDDSRSGEAGVVEEAFVSPSTGQMIGSYRVVAKIGEGGMGTVYRAVDTMVEREVALKSLKPAIAAQPGVVERFRSEAVLLARLNHPNIAQIYSFVKEADVYFMVMEFVAGETLQATIQKGGAIPVPRALAYISQVLQGVGHAHALGVLHRDIKPGNIMITSSGRVKIMDFGIARVLGATGMTRDGRVIGTLEYLAPERIRGKQDDPRSDLYSVGVVLYQMLTGHLPFEADSDYDLLTAQIQKQPPRPSDIGIELAPEVENLLMLALEKNPDRRYPDAASFEFAVNALLGGAHPQLPSNAGMAAMPAGSGDAKMPPGPVPPGAPQTVSGRPPAAPPPAKPPGLSVKMIAICGGVAALVLLAAVGFLLMRHRNKPPVVQATVSAPPSVPVPAPTPPPDEPAPDMVVSASEEAAAAAARPKTSGAAKKGPTEAPKPTPVPLPAAPAAAAGASVADTRRAVLSALDQTDGPANGDPGTRPIQMAGLIAALKLGGQPMEGDIEQAIGRRGVSFQMSSAQADALRTAGATESFIKVVDGNYFARDSATPKPAAKAAEPPPPPKPVPHVTKLTDAKSIFVDCGQQDMREAIRDEIGKQLKGRLQLMDVPARSDVIMHVTVTNPNGASGKKDHAQIHAVVADAVAGNSLWEQDADDRKTLGIFGGDALKRMASRIVKDLKDGLSKK